MISAVERVGRVRGAIALVVLAACGDAGTVAGAGTTPDPARSSSLRVAGTVSSDLGVPVVGAVLRVTVGRRVADGTCAPYLPSVETTTTGGGAFSVLVTGGPQDVTACTTVAVQPPAASGLRPIVVEAPDSPFASGDATPRTVTVRVILTAVVADPPRASHVRVEGVVVAPDQRPVPGAEVRVDVGRRATDGRCVPTLPPADATTSTAGAFSIVIVGGPQSIVACPSVTVTPPPASGLRARTVAAPDAEMRSVSQPALVTSVWVELER